MKQQQELYWQAAFRKWSYRLAFIPFVVGVLVFTGWCGNWATLKSLGVSKNPMYPLSAICFMLVSLSYFLLFKSTKKYDRLSGYFLASLVFSIGFIKLIDAFLGWNALASLNAVVNFASLERAAIPISQMVPGVGLGFVLASTGIVLNTLSNRFNYFVPHQLMLLLFTVGLLALLGYLYDAEKMYGIIFSMPMSLYSGMCFTVFSLSLLFLRPDRGLMKAFTSSLTGSQLLRALIPAAIIMPALLGALALLGLELGWYNGRHGFVYYVFAIIIVFVSVVVFNSILLNKRELSRLAAKKALYDSEEQVRIMFENAPEAVIVVNEEAVIVKWNPEAGRLFGWTEAEVTGKTLGMVLVPDAYLQSHLKGMEQYAATRESSILGKTLDLKAQKKDGTIIDVLVKVSSYAIEDEPFFVGFVRDITERKKMEKHLQEFNVLLSRQVEEKTQQYAEILERVTDGFIAFDTQLRFTYINSRAADMLGRQPQQVQQQQMNAVFTDAAAIGVLEALNQALETQQQVQICDYFQPGDAWFEYSIYPSENGISVFLKDISEQKKKEEEVWEARKLADKLIDSLPGVFYFYDEEGKFIRWNRALEEVTGYSAAEIQELHPTQLFPEDEQDYINGRIQNVFETGSNNAEAHFISKTGEKTPYYFWATLIRYQGKSCLLGTGIDITERKRAEQKLRDSEQKYKLLFDGNPLPMWIVGLPDYQVIDVNQACLAQYGYNRDAFLGLDIAALLPAQDHEKMYDRLDTSFRGLYHSGVWRHQTSDQRILYADIVTHDIYYQGKLSRLISAKDVTGQYLYEEKLRGSYEEVKKLTEYLQKVREDERMRISREIHDELGQLLTALKMDISWVNRNIATEEPKVKKRVENALGYIDFTMTSVRRIASELRPAILDDLGLQAAIKWQIDNFEDRYHIPIEASLKLGDISLSEEYRVGLFRILQESLTNVARHSNAGRVKVELRKEEDRVTLIIADNGKGFEIENKQTKTLGLLGMKERVEGMGGEYTVNSRVGEGTTVTVAVPLQL